MRVSSERSLSCPVVRVLSGFPGDLLYSVRSLARTPGPTLALLFTVALGVGSNAVYQGLIRGLVQGQPSAFETDRIVSIFGRDASGRGSRQLSPADYRRFKARSDIFEWVGAAQISQRTVLLDDRSEVLSVAAVTPDLGHLLTLPADNGVFLKDSIRGNVKRVRIGNADLAVAGHAPPSLDGLYAGRPVDVWTTLPDDNPKTVWVLAKLRPEVTREQASDACCEVGPYTGMSADMNADLERCGSLLQLAAAFVLLIACANVASFQLGRAANTSQQTSLRVALGASRGRLARSVLADSVVVSIAGGALGVVLAVWTSRIVPALLFREDAESLVQVAALTSVLHESAVALAVLILCGLVPVFETPHNRPADVLRRESAGMSRRSRAIRAILVMTQMGACCVLVISTGYLWQGFRAAQQTSISRGGGEPILATVQAHPDVGRRYFADIERAAGALGGVSVRGWTTRLPGNQPEWRSFQLEQRDVPMRDVTLDVVAFTSQTLELFRLPPVAGRSVRIRRSGLSSGSRQ